MTPLQTLLRRGPGSLKSYLSFGGGQGFTNSDFWLADDRSALLGSTGSVGHHETIGSSFEDYVRQAYKANGVVFTCIMVRQLALSEARFQFQRMIEGRPGELYDDPKLSLLHRPAPNQTTGELSSRMEQDASLAGNFYATVVNGRLRRLRPDWVTVVSGVRGDPDASPFELDAEVLGYIYHPKVRDGARRPEAVLLTPAQVVHYSPVPDPIAQWRGMSWLTPVLQEIDADTAAMRHKLKFFQNGAHGNLAIKYDASISPTDFPEWVRLFKEMHDGPENAFKTFHLGAGADPTVLSMDLKQLDFKAVQGHGESRIAAASGVGAIIARLPESMQGAGLMQGNFSSAMRQCADMTFRPLWRQMAGALETVAPPSDPDRLWYDDRDIAFLQQDAKDAADIEFVKAQTMRQLVDGGFDAESVRDAVMSEDLSRLTHTGKLSVQLQSIDGDANAETAAAARQVAELIQKIYLGVPAGVLSAEEAREIANRAGAGLSGPAPSPS